MIYVLGLLKGEGPASFGKSNYRRLTITNSDPTVINIILNELDDNNIFKKSKLINNSIHLLYHTEPETKVINFWSKKLGLPKDKFKRFNDERKTSLFGVCHVYISDLLLRRVIDLIHSNFFI